MDMSFCFNHHFLLWLIFFSFSVPLLFPSLLYGQNKEKSEEKSEPLVLIINYPYQIWASDSTKIHLVLLKPDFIPARGAEVKIGDKVIGKADDNGVCIFDYKPGSDGTHTIAATLTDGGRKFSVVKSFRCNSRTVSFETEHLYVYTDRGVYNPGQRILARILAWHLKGEYSPVPNTKVQLLLKDRSEKVYSGCYVTTNEFGVGSAELPLPENMKEGDYRLVVLYQKAIETTSIRIERFVPPLLKIEHNLKRYLTETQESLPLEVKISYFSGGKIKSSVLVLSVIDSRGKEIFARKFSEKETGVYSFSLEKEDLDSFRSKLAKEQEFKIRLLATDSYGRSDKIDFDVVYTERPFRGVLELDKDSYIEGETVQILAKVADLDGKPAVNIPLVLEVAEFNEKCESKTDEKGVATFTFKMRKQGANAVLRSPIMAEPLGSRVIPYQEWKPLVSKAQEPPKGMGAEAEIVLSFNPDYIPVEKVVHLDLTDISGALVLATTIPIEKDGDKYYAKGKIAAPTWGTMLCNLYCCVVKKSVIEKDQKLSVENVGFVTEGQHITFHPNKTIKLTVEDLKPQVKPGEKVDFTVKLENAKEEACIGAVIVDSAVISLLDPFLKTPEEHFYNPQRKVIASGGAAVLTWPVVDRNWGNPWRDIAYCNWGYKEPGEFVSQSERKTGEPMADSAVQKAAKDAPESPAQEKSEEKSFGSEGLNKAEFGMKEAFVGGAAKAEKKPQKVITIRKSFPETSLWEPLLVTKNGICKLSVTIPDSITKQQLSIVATDKSGNIGFLRREIEVRQSLFISSALPATLTIGDTLRVGALVRNFSESDITCKVALNSEDFEVVSQKEISLSIPKGESSFVEWDIRARICGHNKFTVSVDSERFVDSETKTIFVRPIGEPLVTTIKGALDKNAQWRASTNLSDKAIYHTVFLNVSFPNVFPALQGLEAMARYPHGCVEQTASAALINVAVLEYGRKTKMPSDKLLTLEMRLRYATARLCAMQHQEGCWGWFYLADATAQQGQAVVGGPNLYLTAYALRALTEIRNADIPISDKSLETAIEYILKSRNADGLWSSKGAFFWEVTNEKTDKALSAELFYVLVGAVFSLAPETAKKYENDITELKNKMVSYLKERPEEPLAVANAVGGLFNYACAKDDKELRKLLDESVNFLITLKRKGYWEPHWYHAFGGMIEVNARILELLFEIDPERYDGFLREGVTYLLATREAWGAWHNTMGTQAAVRALLKTDAFEKEIPSKVTVTVNGKTVAEVAIDPQDPYLSAAQLRCLEITPFVINGENEIVVAYDGALKASAILVSSEWGLPLPKTAAAIKVERTAPDSVAVNEPFSVSLRLSSEKPFPYLVVEERIPANADVDVKSLDELKHSGKISDYKLGDAVVFFYLDKLEGVTEITYKLTATREGRANHAGTTVTAMYDSSISASTVAKTLEVKT